MLADAAPIQGKTEYNKQIAQLEQQQAKQAQEQQKIQDQILHSQSQMTQAKAISDIALSKERFTRAVANMGLEDERASKAVENRADTALNRARAIKELQSLDDERLLKYLQVVRLMEEQHRVKEEEIKEDDVEISARANQPPRNVPEVGGLLQEIPQNQQEVFDGQI